VNAPDDPGEATKYGVTVGTMRALGKDLNKLDATTPPMSMR